MSEADAPTPREATTLDVEGVIEEGSLTPGGHRVGPKAFRLIVSLSEYDDWMGAVLDVVDEAASTAAAGEGATLSDAVKDARARGQDIEPGWMDEEQATGDVDAAWEALREAIRWHRGSLGDADPLIEHRPLIEAALRVTSETPRETPLAGPLDGIIEDAEYAQSAIDEEYAWKVVHDLVRYAEANRAARGPE